MGAAAVVDINRTANFVTVFINSPPLYRQSAAQLTDGIVLQGGAGHFAMPALWPSSLSAYAAHPFARHVIGSRIVIDIRIALQALFCIAHCDRDRCAAGGGDLGWESRRGCGHGAH
jgi:hypothetical protein